MILLQAAGLRILSQLGSSGPPEICGRVMAASIYQADLECLVFTFLNGLRAPAIEPGIKNADLTYPTGDRIAQR